MIDVMTNHHLQTKTFVFQHQETQQCLIVDYQLDLSLNFINVNYLLSLHCAPHLHRVSIYDPSSNSFTSLTKLGALNGFLPKEYLQPSIVLIRYKKKLSFDELESQECSADQEGSEDKQDGRSKERTIAQTIELVKRWRQLHLYGHNTRRKRINLQDAAKLVGVSKKSLDDYYYQLRLGEFYGFDFAHKLHEKIGVLRNYVKQHREDQTKGGKKRRQNQKHPKNLQVIQLFQISTKTIMSISEHQEPQEPQEDSVVEVQPPLVRSTSQQSERILEERYQEIREDSVAVFQQLNNLQNEFFRGFSLALDYPNDPYQYGQADFHKKDWEESNSFLYFDI